MQKVMGYLSAEPLVPGAYKSQSIDPDDSGPGEHLRADSRKGSIMASKDALKKESGAGQHLLDPPSSNSLPPLPSSNASHESLQSQPPLKYDDSRVTTPSSAAPQYDSRGPTPTSAAPQSAITSAPGLAPPSFPSPLSAAVTDIMNRYSVPKLNQEFSQADEGTNGASHKSEPQGTPKAKDPKALDLPAILAKYRLSNTVTQPRTHIAFTGETPIFNFEPVPVLSPLGGRLRQRTFDNETSPSASSPSHKPITFTSILSPRLKKYSALPPEYDFRDFAAGKSPTHATVPGIDTRNRLHSRYRSEPSPAAPASTFPSGKRLEMKSQSPDLGDMRELLASTLRDPFSHILDLLQGTSTYATKESSGSGSSSTDPRDILLHQISSSLEHLTISCEACHGLPRCFGLCQEHFHLMRTWDALPLLMEHPGVQGPTFEFLNACVIPLKNAGQRWRASSGIAVVSREHLTRKASTSDLQDLWSSLQPLPSKITLGVPSFALGPCRHALCIIPSRLLSVSPRVGKGSLLSRFSTAAIATDKSAGVLENPGVQSLIATALTRSSGVRWVSLTGRVLDLPLLAAVVFLAGDGGSQRLGRTASALIISAAIVRTLSVFVRGIRDFTSRSLSSWARAAATFTMALSIIHAEATVGLTGRRAPIKMLDDHGAHWHSVKDVCVILGIAAWGVRICEVVAAWPHAGRGVRTVARVTEALQPLLVAALVCAVVLFSSFAFLMSDGMSLTNLNGSEFIHDVFLAVANPFTDSKYPLSSYPAVWILRLISAIMGLVFLSAALSRGSAAATEEWDTPAQSWWCYVSRTLASAVFTSRDGSDGESYVVYSVPEEVAAHYLHERARAAINWRLAVQQKEEGQAGAFRVA
ncbi:hypothetical protein M427DRAFT_27701 [Gonapodya prolifera JEL478]|uniref:Uncharacterized protein n=1 Tax=Gonapodya prolifera (strain JEL478) TaxID=1344416 RepID=A0A139AX40_GONPJ|nr:hypothetical protein M427DRAFT_27701 [Gonapodya prolifera JEL478]|eukprot:KXS21290.1 hypothetical protein M427DRAFT_27701 [Gonapodya prolifera JEL478]